MENAGSVLAEVKEMFAETSRRMDEERAKSRADFDRRLAESAAEADRQRAKDRAEDDRRRAEDDRRRAEDDRRRAEFDRKLAISSTKAARRSARVDRQIFKATRAAAEANRSVAESRELLKKLGIGLKDARTEISGISKSNGMFAEEYFYNSLKETLTFAGIHFDDADETLHGRQKKRGCPMVQDQFDIVLTNKEAAAIIEVKYRGRKEDVELLVENKAKNLRVLYPEYKDLRIYLGLGSMVFDDSTIALAKKYGVGILRQVGETIEEDVGAWEVLAY